MGKISLHHGNCLDVLRNFADNSIDAVITDPPYGLAFMNKKWDYDVPSTAIWREVLRVLKPGGHLLSFGGTRTYHRMVVNIEDAGFEIRDQIQWLYGSGFPKSLDISKAIDKQAGAEREIVGPKVYGGGHLASKLDPGGKTMHEAWQRPWQEDPEAMKRRVSETAPSTEAAKQWEGWGTALKPANEPIVLARKPLERGLTVADNVLKWGVGGLNVDASRIQTEEKLSSGRHTTGDQQGPSGYKTTNRTEYEQAPQGRFPANLILDETAAAMLDAQTGELKSAGEYTNSKQKVVRKSESLFGNDSSRRDNSYAGQVGGASRFFYVAKASKSERNKGLEDAPLSIVSDGREKSIDNPFLRGETERKNTHPTVKPVKLMEYLVKLITPPNGIVLDPFMGSGTTGVACKNLEVEFVGIEREEAYVEIARARMLSAVYNP